MGDHQDDIQVIQCSQLTDNKHQGKCAQIAPSLEEGPEVRGTTEPSHSQTTSGRLKEDEKRTQPSSVLSPPKALPKQTKAKCSLGFCRANQVVFL